MSSLTKPIADFKDEFRIGVFQPSSGLRSLKSVAPSRDARVSWMPPEAPRTQSLGTHPWCETQLLQRFLDLRGEDVTEVVASLFRNDVVLQVRLVDPLGLLRRAFVVSSGSWNLTD